MTALRIRQEFFKVVKKLPIAFFNKVLKVYILPYIRYEVSFISKYILIMTSISTRKTYETSLILGNTINKLHILNTMRFCGPIENSSNFYGIELRDELLNHNVKTVSFMGNYNNNYKYTEIIMFA